MDKSRLAALSDGVIAIIITVMVLELHAPNGASLAALRGSAPGLLTYALSFVYVAIYWNNHHHFYHLVERVTGGMLWANLNLLFWLSLIPFSTDWLAAHPGAAAPAAIYGFSLLMCALAWSIMQAVVVRAQGTHSRLARALRHDWKSNVSLAGYVAGILVTLWVHWIAYGCYLAVAALWLVPDRRMERAAQAEPPPLAE